MLSKERYHIYGDVAQLARVSDWQSEGREFKSLRLHHPTESGRNLRPGSFLLSGFALAFMNASFIF